LPLAAVMDEGGSWDEPDRPLQEGRGRARFWIGRMELLVILRIAFPTILFSWVVPAAIGVWLFWKRK